MINPIILQTLEDEYSRATKMFGAFHSSHEGIAIIKEEVDELWDEIKGEQKMEGLMEEASHVATMAIRFMQDICLKEGEDESMATEKNNTSI